jgi:hypothetical protein
MQYCPSCYNQSLKLSHRGVIHIVINGIKMDTGRFLFNLKSDKAADIRKSLLKKVEEFIMWYSNFDNKDPLSKLSIHSADFKCANQCPIALDAQISVIGVIFPEKDVERMFKSLGEKYGLDVRLTSEEGEDNADEDEFTFKV